MKEQDKSVRIITQKEIDDEALKIKREYKREWQRKNREKVKQYQDDYYRRQALARMKKM
jgi:hypothetical protein